MADLQRVGANSFDGAVFGVLWAQTEMGTLQTVHGLATLQEAQAFAHGVVTGGASSAYPFEYQNGGWVRLPETTRG